MILPEARPFYGFWKHCRTPVFGPCKVKERAERVCCLPQRPCSPILGLPQKVAVDVSQGEARKFLVPSREPLQKLHDMPAVASNGLGAQTLLNPYKCEKLF